MTKIKEEISSTIPLPLSPFLFDLFLVVVVAAAEIFLPVLLKFPLDLHPRFYHLIAHQFPRIIGR